MAYRIEYDTLNKKYEIVTPRSLPFPWMVAMAFVLFLFLTAAFWPEGWEVLRDVVIPGEDAVTLRALSGMSGNLRAGMDLGEAVRTFCEEVLDGASNPY